MGRLYAKNADITGKITATEGKIDGWFIKDGALRSVETATSTNKGVAIKSGGTYAIVAGSTSWDNNDSAPFRVTHAGKLYATEAEIKGTIKADSVITAGTKFSEGNITFGSYIDASNNKGIKIYGAENSYFALTNNYGIL